MSREEIISRLKKVLATVKGVEESTIDCDESTNLLTGLGLNSVGMLYMIIAVENEFGIRFEDTNTSELVTVGKVIDFIQQISAMKQGK